MSKENILFTIIGLLGGLIIGFMFANTVNQRAVANSPAAIPGSVAWSQPNANMPPGHPDVGSAQKGVISPENQAVIENAKASPDDFDLQLKAAELNYQSERYDDAIAFLKAANKLRPDEREVLVHLGNANFDAEHFAEAEKWYVQALSRSPDDVNVRTDLGLTFVFRTPPDYDRAVQEFNRSLSIDPKHIQTLQNLTVAYTKKGDMTRAGDILARLTEVDPTNTAIAKLKAEIK